MIILLQLVSCTWTIPSWGLLILCFVHVQESYYEPFNQLWRVQSWFSSNCGILIIWLLHNHFLTSSLVIKMPLPSFYSLIDVAVWLACTVSRNLNVLNFARKSAARFHWLFYSASWLVSRRACINLICCNDWSTYLGLGSFLLEQIGIIGFCFHVIDEWWLHLYYALKIWSTCLLFLFLLLQANAEADTFFCFVELLSGFRDNFCKQLDNSVVGIRSTIAKLSQLLKKHDEELSRHLEVTTKVC